MTLLLVYIGIALGFSFLCSILEAVLLSVTPSYAAQLEEESPKVGAALKAMKANVDRPLAAILSLNTIAHTIGAAGAGAQAQVVFGSQWLGVASAVLTLLILVVSEIIPKTIGAVYWRRLAPFSARILPWMIKALIPLVLMSELITKAMKARHHGTTISKEEIAALARLGEEQGVFDAKESRVLTNLFRIGSLRARDIMTPRTVMFALPATTRVGDLVPRGARETGEDDTRQRSTMVFSRIPVYQDSLDDIIGYVLKDELFLKAAQNELDRPVSGLVRELHVVPDTLPVATLFEQLVETREHLALVVDEYGGVDGIVTMEDVIETLLGLEIVDEADRTVDMREMARRRWRERRKKMGTIPPPPGDPTGAGEGEAAPDPKEAPAVEGGGA
ncbi:MAG TPA: hemolysin family protein [Polyangiaceae bacterium LLY-WYZ-15_(1-7)]|nr:hemolysin [Sandaracinus sp.]HJK92483.1 hemolysin family protein [Polyangiaceae bacterium LLY-WYZ-15_(1-7)]MBJ70348.1 hemolysin [Sandaracinus sp.]HJL01558.1 hemolysin family protein [Polyangiaceae bacterium LLY-WYZ-15_(1-7)]HJL08598.1 hemolysin family protein [Polyangiaceae bacterium LLY-WYZ-15_(1-7)]